MKKFISLTLAVLMVMAMIPTAFAAELDDICDLCMVLPADICSTCGGEYCYECIEYHDCVPATNDHSQGTKVEYTASGSEAYTITVPALLAPGDEGTVTLAGTWSSDRKVTVTAADDVTLINSINANDKHTLDVTFAGISKAGDNTQSRTYTETVAVAEMPANALFGTWSGTFYYNVEVGAAVEMITFTINGTEFQAEEGMTWAEWVNSEYDDDSYRVSAGQICAADGTSPAPFVTYDGSADNYVHSEDRITANFAYVQIINADIDWG